MENGKNGKNNFTGVNVDYEQQDYYQQLSV